VRPRIESRRDVTGSVKRLGDRPGVVGRCRL